jgi:hypothetical protein
MSLTGVILGTICQAMLGLFIFMVVAFAGTTHTETPLSTLQTSIINACFYLLPGLCVISALIVIFAYTKGAGSVTYWWYALPPTATLVFLVWLSTMVIDK